LAHTQRDSPGGSTPRGQHTFPSEYYEDEHTSLSCLLCVFVILCLNYVDHVLPAELPAGSILYLYVIDFNLL